MRKRSVDRSGNYAVLLISLLVALIASPLIGSVSAGPVASVSIDQSEPISVDADSQYQFSATLYDSQGGVVSGTIGWWVSNGSIDAAGLFTPWTAGVVTIVASSNGFNDSLNISVTPGWPITLDLQVESSTVPIDGSVQLIPLLLDVRGNHAVDEVLTWNPSQGTVNTTYAWTPAGIGEASIEVHWRELTASVNVTVVPGSAAFLLLPEELSLRSGESIFITPEVWDAYGNSLPLSAAGSLQWTAEQGTITPSGEYFGGAVGHWLITCDSGSGASGETNVSVVAAEISSLALIAEDRPYRADEAVPIIVQRTDIYDNVEEVIVSLANWTVEEGALRNGVNATEWLPGAEGNWTIGVQVEGLSASITLEVVHGHASELLIVTDSLRISADDDVVLHMQARDIRNNRWVVTGTWETEDAAASDWLESFGTWANFDASTAGTWVIEGSWFDDEQQIILTGEIELEVIPGRLAEIVLQGDGAIISTDEVLDLAPQLYDSDGNEIGAVLLNWSVDNIDQTTSFRLHRGVYYPQATGLHEIRAHADGAFSSIMLEVTPGRARNLSLDIPSSVSISAGGVGEVSFNVLGQDLSNNSFLVDELEWTIPEGAGEMRAGTASGEWIFQGQSAGDYLIELVSDDALFILAVQVTPGPANSIDVVLDREDELRQGEELVIDIRIYDAFGNELNVGPSEIEVSSTAGKVTHLNGGSWKLSLDTGGTDHAVTIRHEGITEQRFFDVEGALLGGLLGSSNAVVLSASMVIALILGILVVLMRSARSEDDDEWLEESHLTEPKSVPKVEAVSVVQPESHPVIQPTLPAPSPQHAQPAQPAPAPQPAPAVQPVQPVQPTPQPAPAPQPAPEPVSVASTLPDLKPLSPPTPEPAPEPVLEPQPNPVSEPTPVPTSEPAPAPAPSPLPDEASEFAKDAAARAKATGVMVAAEGTEQGESGWYYDTTGELTRWVIEPNGTWARIK